MPRNRKALPLALAVVLVVTLAACGKSKKKEAATTTTVPPTTTTTASVGFPAGAAPLTGLPGKPELATRPALIVKIDNAPKARPQVGILAADVVVVEKVEDGVTRFFTIFHSKDADPVGPVRSARSTDIAMASSLNRPLFSYSGANATFQKLINAAPLVNVGIAAQGGLYRRDPARPKLYSVMTTTASLFSKAPAGSKAPAPMFAYRLNNSALMAAGAAPAGGAHIEYRGIHVNTIVDWKWDAAAKVWKRSQDGGPHLDAAGAQVAAPNMIVQFIEYVNTGEVDQSGTIVPEGKLVGSGEAWVFTDGKVVKGKWTKASPTAVTTYTDSAGKPIGLTPGTTWVELSPVGQSSLA
jgi:hypothetical protein